MERLTGYTIDISEWTEFELYGLCWYWVNQTDKTEVKIGRFIGVSHQVGRALCDCFLNEKGNIIARTTVKQVT